MLTEAFKTYRYIWKKVSVSTVKRELRDAQSQNKMFRIQIDWCAKNKLVLDDMQQYLNNPLS